MSDAKKKERPTQVVVGPLRVFYVHAFNPKETDNGKKYQVQGLIRKDDKASLDLLRRAVIAAKEAFEAKYKVKFIDSKHHQPIRDGDVEFESGEKKDPDYKGHFFFNASAGETNPPQIIDRQGEEILDRKQVYSGMFARLIINFYPFDKAGKRGIAVGFNALQRIRDGEPKAGIGSAGEIFGRYEVDGDEEDAPTSSGAGF